jgi:hypothetical protein
MADRRFALIIATSQYSDPTLTQLMAPANDAESLATVLDEPTIGGFDVRTLIDQPVVSAMQEIEAFFDGRARDDLVLLYFSGHGILDQSARLYFATIDTQVERPRSTAVPASFVNDVMSESRSRRQVLVLDCCNSGAFARGVKAGGNIGTRERFEGRGRVVITASDALQYAFEAGRIEGEGVRSVFTEILVQGLQTGEADLDDDGHIALDELYDYIYERVVDSSPRQRPGKWAFGVEGRIFIAKATPPAVRPDGTPREPRTASATAEAHRFKARTRRLLAPRRRLLIGAALVLAAAGIAVAVTSLLGKGTTKPNSSSPSLTAERQASNAVYDAWTSGELTSLTARQIAQPARLALEHMPTEPIVPNRAGTNDCSGVSGNAGCAYNYPGLSIFLNFTVLGYADTLRVSDVKCFSNSGQQQQGGIAACARIVGNS